MKRMRSHGKRRPRQKPSLIRKLTSDGVNACFSYNDGQDASENVFYYHLSAFPSVRCTG